MKYKISSIVGLLLGLWFHSFVQADIAEMSICHQDNLKPPYLMLNEQGKPIGIVVEIVEEIMRRKNITLTQRVIPWKRCLTEVAAGNIDLATNASYKKAREEFAYYTARIYSTHFMLYYRNAIFPSPPKVTSMTELADYVVGGVLGYNYSMFDGIDLDDQAKDRSTLIRKLKVDRVDFAAVQDEVLLYQKQQGDVDISGLSKIPSPVQPVKHSYLLLSRKHKKPGRALDIINSGIAELAADGTSKRIQQKYLGDSQ